jgi:hypothetical protein
LACSRVRIESNLFLGYKCAWPWMTHWNNSKTLYKHSYLLKLTTSMLSLFYTRFLMTRQKKYASHVCLSWMAQLTLLDVCTLLLVWISKFALGRLIYIIYELWYLGVARPQIENNCDVTTPMSGLWGYSSWLLKQSLQECSPVGVWDHLYCKGWHCDLKDWLISPCMIEYWIVSSSSHQELLSPYRHKCWWH